MVIVAEKVPFADAVTAVEVSIAATFVLPQGFAVEGRWTSLRFGAPWRPRTGEMAAWACAWRERPRQSATVAMEFLEKIIVPDFEEVV